MPRGGKRAGAGAPRGNMNALRTGRYSPRMQALAAALLTDPAFAPIGKALTRALRRRRVGSIKEP
jgi:hypothetical protein